MFEEDINQTAMQAARAGNIEVLRADAALKKTLLPFLTMEQRVKAFRKMFKAMEAKGISKCQALAVRKYMMGIPKHGIEYAYLEAKQGLFYAGAEEKYKELECLEEAFHQETSRLQKLFDSLSRDFRSHREETRKNHVDVKGELAAYRDALLYLAGIMESQTGVDLKEVAQLFLCVGVARTI